MDSDNTLQQATTPYTTDNDAPDDAGRAGQAQTVQVATQTTPDATQATQRKRGRPRKAPLAVAVVPDNAAQVVPAKPIPSSSYRRPLPMLQSEPTPYQIDICIQLAKASGIELDSPDGLREALTGVERSSDDAQARSCLFLSSIALGSRHKESFALAGMSSVDVCVFTTLCPNFGKMYDYARKLQGESMGHDVLSAALDRAVDGVEEPVIGRVGKDQDGIITTKRRYSDKLAETLLRGTDKRFRDDSGTHATGASTTYNINFDYRQQVAVTMPGNTPAPQLSGGNMAEKTVKECQGVDIAALTDD